MITDHDIIFGAAAPGECDFCGISSFAHIHRQGSRPNEFERTTDIPAYLQVQDNPTATVLHRLRERVVERTAQIKGSYDSLPSTLVDETNGWLLAQEEILSYIDDELKKLT